MVGTFVGAAAAAGTGTGDVAAGAAAVAGIPIAAPTMGTGEAAVEALNVVGPVTAEAWTLTTIAAAFPRPLTNNHLGTRGLVITAQHSAARVRCCKPCRSVTCAASAEPATVDPSSCSAGVGQSWAMQLVPKSCSAGRASQQRL